MDLRAKTILEPAEKHDLRVPILAKFLLLIGLVTLAISFVVGRSDPQESRHFWFAYLVNFAFFLSLSLGALFFVMLQHVTRSGWSVVVRRPAEAMAANLAVLAVLFVPLLLAVAVSDGRVYPWARPVNAPAHEGPAAPTAVHVAYQPDSPHEKPTVDPAHAAAADPTDHHADALLLEKKPYLNVPFFAVRWLIYFVIWTGLAVRLWRQSARQDGSGDADLTARMERLSAPGLVIYGLTVTFAAFDLIMSLDPHWYSTILGVYFYSGGVIGFFALLILLLMQLQRRGLLTRSVTAEHYHDLGKLLFAFVFFWGYIAFSQYMLIWYANIPEETGWFARRGAATQAPNVWSPVLLVLLFGHFLIPFVGLLSRHVKRAAAALAFWAVWMLVMHWIDLYWLIMPEFTTQYLPLGLFEVGCFIGLGSVFLAGLVRFASRYSLVPLRDPRLAESLAFHNT